MWKLIFALILVVGMSGCGNGNDTAAPPEETPPAEVECIDLTNGESATIEMHDNFFEPACAIVSAGQGLNLPNEGDLIHNFSIEGGPDVDLDVQSGEETRTEAIGGIAEPGTYTFFCKFHRAGGMEGEIEIRET